MGQIFATEPRPLGGRNSAMTKADLVEAVYKCSGLSRHEATTMVETVIDVVKEALQQGEPVQIVCFGTFRVRRKGARIGRNPKTGQTVTIAPRKVLSFKPSTVISRLLNHKPVTSDAAIHT